MIEQTFALTGEDRLRRFYTVEEVEKFLDYLRVNGLADARIQFQDGTLVVKDWVDHA